MINCGVIVNLAAHEEAALISVMLLTVWPEVHSSHGEVSLRQSRVVLSGGNHEDVCFAFIPSSFHTSPARSWRGS